MGSYKIALLIEYDGTGFSGYQLQGEGRTVQGELEGALKKLSGAAVRVYAASRTDAGVHACGQVVSFWIREELAPTVVVRGLNHFVAEDIAVRGACVIDGDFDVRRRAVSRTYRYVITRAATRSPLRERFSLHVRESLDVPAMRSAVRLLQGMHDFASFATSLEDGEPTVRTVYEARIVEIGDDTVVISMCANAFLRHQVRNTVGQLLRVGLGKCSVDRFVELMSRPCKGAAGPAAPSHGLSLMQVRYQPALPFAA